MILVTGATGNIGSNVARQLRDQGVKVRAFVRDRAKAADMLGHDVELAAGDFSDKASVEHAVRGAEAVFVACANEPQQVDHETGVIDAAAAAGVRRIVKLSAFGAEIGSPLAFWDWHGRIEAHLKSVGVPWVILQPTGLMVYFFLVAEQIRRDGRFFSPVDDGRVSFVDPRDVAAVAVVTLTEDGHERQTHVLSGPEAITQRRAAEYLSVVTGRDIEFVNAPEEGARQGLLASGMPVWFADQIIEVFRMMRRGHVAEVTDTVRKLTGRAPRTLGEFALDHAALFGAAPGATPSWAPANADETA